MPFVCPQRAAPGCLKIVHCLELLSDARSDEITLQIVACSRRGSLDSEAFDHTGYRVSKDKVAELQRAISHCPEPGNPRCFCPVHHKHGRRDAGGGWDGWTGLGLGRAFALVVQSLGSRGA
jgi:hypothetical protein